MRFERAILTNPPNPPGYVSNKDSMGGFGQLFPSGAPPFPPLDLANLGASLARRFQVHVIEAGGLRLDTAGFVAAVREVASDQTLVMVRTSLPTIDWDLKVCGSLRQQAPAVRIGIFGAIVPHLAERIQAAPEIDFAVIGEPDQTVAELMERNELDSIPGLMYRSGGTWCRNPDRQFEDNLDSLPFPRWDLMPTDQYVIPKSSAAGRQRFLPMLTSRGCPYGCSYCPYPVGQGLRWRFRSPASVVDEMEHLIKNFGVEHILFRDPMFSLRQERVVEICEEILRRNLKVGWKCETRVDCLDPETIAVMARAGCVGINFGVESTDPQIQKGVHRKPIRVEEFVEKVAVCRQHDIKTFAFFIVGLPGDTIKTLLDSIQFAVDIRANWTQFTVATPFVGTRLHDWAVEHELIEPDFYEIVSSHVGSVGNENLRPDEVRRLHRFAQFLQNNLINRRGVLKNHNRRDLPYRAAKGAADLVSHALAVALVRLGRFWFRRRTPAHKQPTAEAAVR
jgi:radical SAM superfamily enzyme YgiQ (UPF0313 family)